MWVEQGSPTNRSWALVTVAAALLSPAARADSWRIGAPDLVRIPSGSTIQVATEGGYTAGLVPEFRSGSRDRGRVGVAAEAWWLRGVRVSAEWGWLWDSAPALSVNGPGDVRLGTAVRAASLGDLSFGLGWGVKLPDATNENELGTDETDVLFGAWAGWARGPWAASAAAGLGVYGNPLRFANQDDVPLLRADLAWSPGPLAGRLFVNADLATARNPARVEVGGAIRYGEAWFAELEGSGGLTPAAADGRVTLRLGGRFALPTPGVGE